MALTIGKVIAEKRKAKMWTQEQLANAVGVSTPAVSKWETGATFPDITLLSPIARALDTTVDVLFSYQNELTDAAVTAYAKAAFDTYETKGFEAGFAFCQQLLHEYPNSIPLKYHIGGLFQNFLILKPGFDKEDVQTYYTNAAALYEDVLTSGEARFAYSATTILISYYVMLNELSRAEELYQTLPKIKVDPDLLYPSILTLRGEYEKAIELTQENLYRSVARIRQLMTLLRAYALEQHNVDAAYRIAKTSYDITSLFGQPMEVAYADLIRALLVKGDTSSALTYLEAYVDAITALDYSCASNPLFSKLNKEPPKPKYIQSVLAQSILQDSAYEVLSSEPRFQKIAEQLQRLLTQPVSE